MTVEDDDLEKEQQPSNDDDDDDEDDDEESIRIMDIDTTFRQLLIPLASASWDAQSPRDRKAVLQTMQQQLRHNPLARNFLAEQSIGQYGLQSNRTHVVHTYIHTYTHHGFDCYYSINLQSYRVHRSMHLGGSFRCWC